MSDKLNENSENTDNNLANNIDILAEQVRMLALNLAINLARAKNDLKELAFMEDEFTKLVNGSVEVIREISTLSRVFKNEDKMVYMPPTKSGQLDRIETSLNDILDLSKDILSTITTIKKRKREVDNLE